MGMLKLRCPRLGAPLIAARTTRAHISSTGLCKSSKGHSPNKLRRSCFSEELGINIWTHTTHGVQLQPVHLRSIIFLGMIVFILFSALFFNKMGSKTWDISTSFSTIVRHSPLSFSKTDIVLPKTLNGEVLYLFDPYAIPDDPNIGCVPLKSALKLEKICTYPSAKDAYISKVLNDGQVWEAPIINLMKGVFNKPGNEAMGLIDLGTNLGVFAITAASMNHTVVGVEPLPANLVRLAKTMRLNKHLMPRLRILPNAASDKYETMYFWAQDNNVHPGGTKTRGIEVTKDPKHHQLASLTAKSIRTDDMLYFIDFRRAIMKADIEGGEYKAFQTAHRMFDTIEITHVFMEWNKKHETEHERKFFINFFKTRGYTVHRPDSILTPLELSEEASWKWPFDVVFVKQIYRP